MAWTLSDTNKNTSIWILIPLFCAGLFAAALLRREYRQPWVHPWKA